MTKRQGGLINIHNLWHKERWSYDKKTRWSYDHLIKDEPLRNSASHTLLTYLAAAAVVVVV